MDKTNFLKLAIIGSFVAAVGAIWLISESPRVGAASDGPSPSHTGAPAEDNCASCHTSFDVNSGSGSVTISGVPSTYTPGEAVGVTVTTSDPNATIYGFQFTAIDGTGVRAGTFSLPTQIPAQMKLLPAGQNPLNRQYVEHTSDGIIPTAFGSKSWTFTWTAPSQNVGRVDFYVAGNAANSDSSTSGDYIYTATTFSVPAATALSISGRVRTPTGSGMGNVSVRLVGLNGLTLNTTTSSFGLYTFSNLPGNTSYSIRVASKRFKFLTKNETLMNTSLTNADFDGKE